MNSVKVNGLEILHSMFGIFNIRKEVPNQRNHAMIKAGDEFSEANTGRNNRST